jgi:hypothetical protein
MPCSDPEVAMIAYVARRAATVNDQTVRSINQTVRLEAPQLRI